MPSSRLHCHLLNQLLCVHDCDAPTTFTIYELQIDISCEKLRFRSKTNTYMHIHCIYICTQLQIKPDPSLEPHAY